MGEHTGQWEGSGHTWIYRPFIYPKRNRKLLRDINKGVCVCKTEGYGNIILALVSRAD